MGAEPPYDLTRDDLTPAEPADLIPAPPDDLTVSPTLPSHPPTTGGRGLRWVLFFGGAVGLALGAIAVRAAAILSGRIDPDLVTTPELESFALIAALARLALAITAVHRGRRRLTLGGPDAPLARRAHG